MSVCVGELFAIMCGLGDCFICESYCIVVMKCVTLWLACLCYRLYQRSTDLCDHQCISARVCIHLTCEY